jgi:hypothetical protein
VSQVSIAPDLEKEVFRKGLRIGMRDLDRHGSLTEILL